MHLTVRLNGQKRIWATLRAFCSSMAMGLMLRRQQLQLAFCWAHVRRKFYELKDKSPVAVEVQRRIALFYAVEVGIRGLSAEQRRAARQSRSRIVIDDLHQYLDARQRQVSAKAKIGEAISYALTRWDGLSRFLDDGRIDLNSNTVERSIRPLAPHQLARAVGAAHISNLGCESNSDDEFDAARCLEGPDNWRQ